VGRSDRDALGDHRGRFPGRFSGSEGFIKLLCCANSPLATGIKRARAQFTQRYHPSPDHFLYTPASHTGVGFFDFLHGQSGVAANGIELHPVLDIQFGANVKTAPSPPKPKPGPPPVPSHGTFTLRAYVSPSSMPYNAYPTLYGQTISGASCTASVVYSTGRQPRSFDGSARTAGSNGLVSWNWHEETSGDGGTASVQCRYRGQDKSVQVAFTVIGGRVVWFHRTIEDYVRAVQQAGFRITRLSECAPSQAHFTEDPHEYQRRCRVPLFLLLVGEKT